MMNITKRYFGKTKGGDEVYEYSLYNDSSSHVSILNYGGTITEIYVPDREKRLENIVLGLKNIEDYEKSDIYLGCIAGRTAGRISGASFEIDGISYNLEANNNRSNLHGGPDGFNRRVWDAEEVLGNDYAALELRLLSPDGDQGYPGNLNVKVTYKFDNKNNLEISYEAVTDKKTVITLTNHSYFNLSGNYKTDILNHVLRIDADKYIEVDSETIPTKISEVQGTPLDFRIGKIVGSDINRENEQLKNAYGYDHPFILNQKAAPQIVLEDNTSGRVLEITTDQPTVVLYTGNFIENNHTLRGDIKSQNRLGLCLETQWYPDAVNQPFLPKYILNPGEVYTAKTVYSFK